MPQLRKRGRLIHGGHFRFIEVSKYDPSRFFRFRKACLDNFAYSLCFCLPYQVCLFGVWVGCFEVTHKKRESLEVHLKTIASEQRVISKVIGQLIKTEVCSGEMRVALDAQRFDCGKHRHVETTPVIPGQTYASRVIWRSGWNKKAVTKEIKRNLVKNLLQRDDVGLNPGNHFGGQFPI